MKIKIVLIVSVSESGLKKQCFQLRMTHTKSTHKEIIMFKLLA